MFATTLTTLLFSLLVLLLPRLAAAAPSSNPMTDVEFKEQGVWGPTSVFYWRCRTPLVVETSWDLDHWIPSSVCLEGTCCSRFASGPLCSREACTLVGEQDDKPAGQDPVAVSGGNVPKRPAGAGMAEQKGGK